MMHPPQRIFPTAGNAGPSDGSLPAEEGRKDAARADEKGDPLTETPVARLRRIADQYYDALWRTLRYLGVPDAGVDDAAQQALCVLARRLDDIQRGAEKAFLFATAIRVASEARRAARRNHSRPSARIDAFPAHGPTPEELVDERRAHETLRAIVDAMPPELRAVFVLFEIEELSLSEIAGLLGIPAGTAASRLRRARETFRAIVKRRQAAERSGMHRGRP
jgi:RNA polymerase sigma-70 factor (ECF subfamily)